MTQDNIDDLKYGYTYKEVSIFIININSINHRSAGALIRDSAHGEKVDKWHPPHIMIYKRGDLPKFERAFLIYVNRIERVTGKERYKWKRLSLKTEILIVLDTVYQYRMRKSPTKR